MEIECVRSDGICQYLVWDDWGSRVIGSAIIAFDSSYSAIIRNINISPSHRGNGVGGTLLERISSDFDRFKLFAEVFDGRVEWYTRHGFEVVGKRGSLVCVCKAPAG